MHPKSVLVTGANGLLGFDIVKRLVSEGREVVAIDRSISDVRLLTPNAFEVEIGDVHKLHELAFRFNVSAIIHCGGISGPMLGKENPAMLFRTNIQGTVDVAEVARQIGLRAGSCRLLFCSSLTVYGNQPVDDITEDFPLLAQSCYASSKIAGEKVALAYYYEHGVDAIILRIAGVYGPRRKTSCVLRLMIGDALAGRPTRLSFGQGFPRQFVHVDDVVTAIILALDVSDLTSRVFNISAGENPNIDEAAAVIKEFIPTADIKLLPGPDPEDSTLGLLDIDAARSGLDYVPKVKLREGIERLIASMREANAAHVR